MYSMVILIAINVERDFLKLNVISNKRGQFFGEFHYKEAFADHYFQNQFVSLR